MKKSWVTRVRLTAGVVLLIAAVIAWFLGLAMSPHEQSAEGQAYHMRSTVVVFLRHSAFGNLVLSGLAAWLLYPSRRPDRPVRDWVIFTIIVLIVLTSLYELFWLRSVVY